MNSDLATTEARPARAAKESTVRLVVVPSARAGQPASVGLLRLSPHGLIRSIQTTVRLDAKVGHVYDLGSQGGMNISATGYDHINKAMGVTRYMPPTVIGDDGKPHANPWVIRDRQGSIKRMTVRMCGFGRNSVSSWQLVASKLHYDLDPMLAQDAMKKWRLWGGKDKPKIEQGWGKLYSAENVSDADKRDPSKKCIAIPPGFTLVVSLVSEVLDLIENHVNRIRFCGRLAETIAWRRVLKVFVGQQKIDPGNPSVVVTSWPQSDREGVRDIEELVRQAETGDAMVDGEAVQFESATSVLDDVDEVDIELQSEQDDGGGSTKRQAGQTGQDGHRDLPLARSQIQTYAKKLPADVVDRILGQSGLSGLDEVMTTGDIDLLRQGGEALKEAIDRRASSKPGQQEFGR